MPGPFDALESAHEYVTLLVDQVRDVKMSVAADMDEVTTHGGGRRLDALRLVDFKLSRLERDLVTSRRNLNDLRTLRRLLLDERRDSGVADDEHRATPSGEPHPDLRADGPLARS